VAYVDCVLTLLPYVIVDSVADVSEVYVASSFSVDPENGGSIHLRIFSSIACSHTVQQLKNKMKIIA
jgi:hypothetical protein